MIRLSMYQINGAQSVMVPMSVSYRECEVVEYTTPKIEDLEFTYQSFDPLAIFFDFDQGSCIYQQSYEAFLLVGAIELPLPEFV